jgi:phosphoribosylaminoimidazole-succinocarboxamide synthase
LQVKQYRSQLEGRTMLVKKLKMLPVEAIVRGYITGSGWKVCRESYRAEAKRSAVVLHKHHISPRCTGVSSKRNSLWDQVAQRSKELQVCSLGR